MFTRVLVVASLASVGLLLLFGPNEWVMAADAIESERNAGRWVGLFVLGLSPIAAVSHRWGLGSRWAWLGSMAGLYGWYWLTGVSLLLLFALGVAFAAFLRGAAEVAEEYYVRFIENIENQRNEQTAALIERVRRP